MRDAADVIPPPFAPCGVGDDLARGGRDIEIGACLIMERNAIQRTMTGERAGQSPLIIASVIGKRRLRDVHLAAAP